MHKNFHKLVASCVSAAMLISGTAVSGVAHATTLENDTAVAGIAVSLNNYYMNSESPEADILDYLKPIVAAAAKKQTATVVNVRVQESVAEQETSSQELDSPEVGIVSTTGYVNLRKEPSTESQILAYLYSNCRVDIYGSVTAEDGSVWYRVQTEGVEGYVHSGFVLTGAEAKAAEEKITNKYATVLTESLDVYNSAGAGAEILGTIYEGDTFPVMSMLGDYVLVRIREDFWGYVQRGSVRITTRFPQAVLIDDQFLKGRLDDYLREIDDAKRIYDERMSLHDYYGARSAIEYAIENWGYYINTANDAGLTDLIAAAKQQRDSAVVLRDAVNEIIRELEEEASKNVVQPSEPAVTPSQPATQDPGESLSPEKPSQEPTVTPPSQTPGEGPSQEDTPGTAPQPSGTPGEEPSSEVPATSPEEPSSESTQLPGEQPSSEEFQTPGGEPSSEESQIPGGEPSSEEAQIPSGQPSSEEAQIPSGQPSSEEPAQTPSGQPSSEEATQSPSGEPSSEEPTQSPSEGPSSEATAAPGEEPTLPSQEPSSEVPSGGQDENPSYDMNIPGDSEVMLTGIEARYIGGVKHAGDILSKEDMYVHAWYSDGTEQDITDPEAWTSPDTGYSLPEGGKVITVYYGNMHYSFTLQVLPAESVPPYSEEEPTVEELPSMSETAPENLAPPEESVDPSPSEEVPSVEPSPEIPSDPVPDAPVDPTMEPSAELPPETPADPTVAPAEPLSPQRQQVVDLAAYWVGKCNYVYGQNNLTIGGAVDCSAFTMNIFATVGVSLSRSSAAQRYDGTQISYEQLRAGDIVCYEGHVAIYIGNGTIIHAKNEATGIVYDSIFFNSSRPPIAYVSVLP